MKKTKRFAPTHSHLVQDVVLRNSHQVPIYSIHSSPTNSHLFCTSGRWLSFVRLSITTFETFLTGTSSSGCLIGDIWVWKQEGVVRYFDNLFQVSLVAYIKLFSLQVYRHCPTDLRDSDSFKAYITCAVFSGDGQEVKISSSLS